eukprot:3097307-Prymnesium_polylepis.1
MSFGVSPVLLMLTWTCVHACLVMLSRGSVHTVDVLMHVSTGKTFRKVDPSTGRKNVSTPRLGEDPARAS